MVPLQYVSAQTVVKLIDSFATKPGMVRADGSRNLVLIQGSGSERRNTADLVLSFDADWMRGQSVGIFPVQNSNPEPIIAELEKIVDSGEGGVTQNRRQVSGHPPNERGARGHPQARTAPPGRDLDQAPRHDQIRADRRSMSIT